MSGTAHRRLQSKEIAENMNLGTGHDLNKANLKGDRWNIFILLVLYLLQGIPLGLSAAIPMILQSRGATFKQQAEFSFVNWPFSLKLIWAPLVDAIYWKKFGRRKTWLIPAQYLIGFFMLFLSFFVTSWLGNDVPKVEPNITLLTFLFFTLNFLAATQDIAVDGWALTMLKRRNVGYASTCNSVGQTAGYFLGYVVFIALESPSFCNNYLRSHPLPHGLVTLSGFLYFWAVTYLISTSLIAVFKHETEETSNIIMDPKTAVVNSYLQLIRILALPTVRKLAFLLLTVKIGFAACDAVTSLKLIEGGVPKDKLAILAVPLVPLQIMLPVVLAKFHNPARPMALYLKVFPFRLLFNIVAAFMVFITPIAIGNNEIPFSYYCLLLFILALHQVTMYGMFVEAMSFFALISDPAVGGTNMTLLNTLHNLGGTWTSTVALWAVDMLTWKSCSNDSSNTCSSTSLIQACDVGKGTCETTFDGYYTETILCSVIGFLWFWKFRKTLNFLQKRPPSEWHSR